MQSVHMEVLPSQRKACQGNKDTETQYSKSSTYELSSWELSKMWTGVPAPVWQLLCCTTLLFKVLMLPYQSCPTLCNPVDCSLWGSSVHGVLQARILQLVAMTSSRGSLYGIVRLKIFFCCCSFLCGYYLCEKYCKTITVQSHIATCVSWIPRLTLLDLGTILDYECTLGTELICI